jgi:hypothetical protein
MNLAPADGGKPMVMCIGGRASERARAAAAAAALLAVFGSANAARPRGTPLDNSAEISEERSWTAAARSRSAIAAAAAFSAARAGAAAIGALRGPLKT